MEQQDEWSWIAENQVGYIDDNTKGSKTNSPDDVKNNFKKGQKAKGSLKEKKGEKNGYGYT